MTSSLKIEPRVLGQEGETCAECGAQLGTDQRYCLNCGRRRAEPRIPYEQYLRAEIPPSEAAVRGEEQAMAPVKRELSPLMTAAIVAALGVMLLIGVLIGKGNSPQQASAPPAVVKVDQSGTGETATAAPAAGAKTKKAKKTGAKGSGVPTKQVDSLTSGGAKKGQTVTASKQALESLDNSTGQDYQDSIEKLPDKIATPGKPPPQDPNGQAGAGSGAQVIK
jgi:hypothetical protein